MSVSKRVATNTLFLYIRLILTLGVTLFTSRVVLNTLGVRDYGIYSIVGGVVALFGFLNAAMASATQRYLAFDLGKNNFENLRKTFNSTILIHIGISVVILFFAETLGLWYVNAKLNVDPGRMTAVNWVYQFSVLTSIIGVMQVPYNAIIIARERMNVFAMLSIVDVILKLVIVYILLIIPADKLVFYSILVFSVTLLVALSYRVYCKFYFEECKFKYYKDKAYYKELLSYSGWNLFGNFAFVAKGQGINMVLNVFFGTIVNAAYGITMQVQSAINIFVSNFQLAFNPQIIKNYSQGNYNQTLTLIFQSCKFSFFLMLILISPVLLDTEFVMNLWLKTPPENTILFVQLSLIAVLIDCISGPLMVGAQATGNIKLYQIVVGTLVFLNLPISYLALSFELPAASVFVVNILISFIALGFRVFFLRGILKLNISSFFSQVLLRILLIGGVWYLLLTGVKMVEFNANIQLEYMIRSVLLVSFLIMFIFLLGFNKKERMFIAQFVKSKLHKNEK